MGRVLTNNVSLRSAVETTQGQVPVANWFLLEPNSIGTYGATITTVARSPISNLRQERKGVVTDLDSTVEFESDLIFDHFIRYTEGFLFAVYSDVDTFVPSEATAGAYTVPAITAGQDGRLQDGGLGGTDAATLVYTRGFAQPQNNGLKVISAPVASTDTSITVTGAVTGGSDPVAEVAPLTSVVRIDVAGVRAADSDLEIDVDGNLVSTVLDFTLLGLTIGQAIFIGGVDTANRFTDTANRGIVLVSAIEANRLVLERRGATFVAENGAGLRIDLLFGRFCRNVPVTDPLFIERTYSFELEYPGLDNPTGDAYEYSVGNGCDSLSLNIPLTDKATMAFGFVGLDTPPPQTNRLPGPVDALVANETAAISTTSGVVALNDGSDSRLRLQKLDETGITTCFKDLTITINNAVSPEKCIGTLGARFLNNGNFTVGLEGQVLFTDIAVPIAIRNNETLTFETAIRNSDGAVHINVPALTISGGDREFPVNESVLLNFTGTAFVDPILQNSLGISLFPFAPTS